MHFLTSEGLHHGEKALLTEASPLRDFFSQGASIRDPYLCIYKEQCTKKRHRVTPLTERAGYSQTSGQNGRQALHPGEECYPVRTS